MVGWTQVRQALTYLGSVDMLVRCLMVPLLPALLVSVGGCVELQQALHGGIGDSDGGGPHTPPNDTEPDGQPDAGVPVVRLSVSNPAPQVNEEVLLTCSVVNGDSGGVTFDFQPADGRLFVDHTAGTATFIVEQADIGVAFAFTCTGATQDGTSQPSNEELIVPTS